MSQGSGFVAHKDGKVVTNYHVIRGAGSTVVKFPDGAFYNAEGFLGIDPGRDIAILKISSPSREFPSLQLADASEVTVGRHVVAIGSPMSLENTVSDGIISTRRIARDLDLNLTPDLQVFQVTARCLRAAAAGLC